MNAFGEPAVTAAGKTVRRGLLAMAALQGIVIAGLAILDAVKKRDRSRRKGFPRRVFLTAPSPIRTSPPTPTGPICTAT
jgi:hypothetical protein